MSFYCKIQYSFCNSADSLNVEFNLLDSDILHLAGNNGVGKTTLLNLINGFLSPTCGIIKLNNLILFDKNKGINISVKKRQIAIVFQQSLLFPNMNVKQNLDFANKNPKLLNYLITELKIQPLLKKTVLSLSGGQQQKVAIVQSLINKPKMLLLDEAFSNLDINNTHIIKNIILDMKIPVIITTHNNDDVKNFITKTLILGDT